MLRVFANVFLGMLGFLVKQNSYVIAHALHALILHAHHVLALTPVRQVQDVYVILGIINQV